MHKSYVSFFPLFLTLINSLLRQKCKAACVRKGVSRRRSVASKPLKAPGLYGSLELYKFLDVIL